MISREQFMEYYRSDKYSEELSPDDKVEVFMNSLAGESDITQKLLQDLADDYNSGKVIVAYNEKEVKFDDVVSLYTTAEKIKERYRESTGRKILVSMLTDEDAPAIFTEVLDSFGIKKLAFEKVVTSADYMPDSGWYIILICEDGDRLGFLYNDLNSYREEADDFDGADMQCEDDVIDCFENRDFYISKKDATLLWNFMLDYKKHGLKYELYDYEGSLLS